MRHGWLTREGVDWSASRVRIVVSRKALDCRELSSFSLCPLESEWWRDLEGGSLLGKVQPI